MTKVAIIQSNYIPWRGYFDIIDSVDEFILFDDRQFTKRDWRNRNIVLTPAGPKWLSIPVISKGRYHQRIDETRIGDSSWAKSHWDLIRNSYGNAPYWDEFQSEMTDLWLSPPEELLTHVNERFLKRICESLGIDTRISRCSEYTVDPELVRTERIVALCHASGATSYLTGPSARDYLAPDQFSKANINLCYIDYSGYRNYPQLHTKEFESAVSIIDTICNTGFSNTIEMIRADRSINC